MKFSLENQAIIKITIDSADVYLENYEEGKGKIVISDSWGHNYSYYWGSMGRSLEEFICDISEDYFVGKLLGARSCYTMNIKKTFTELRKFIREEFGLPWYKHLEFQKDLRYELKRFENNCDSANQFVDGWYRFVGGLPYWNIECKFEMKEVEDRFKGISEPWNFIVETVSEEYKWLAKLHQKLKNELQSKESINCS